MDLITAKTQLRRAMVVGKENMEATAPVVDEGGEIVKPRTDKREYRRILLKNSLEVLLISDPETDKVRFYFSSAFTNKNIS